MKLTHLAGIAAVSTALLLTQVAVATASAGPISSHSTVVGASSAFGASSSVVGGPAAAQGVARAEAAGIQIDAAAVSIMEAAPLGSCLNNPVQAQCGPLPTRIVGTTSSSENSARGGLSTTTFALSPVGSSAADASLSSGRHASPAVIYECTVGASVSETYGPATAHGTAAQSCPSVISEQYVYSTLQSFWTYDSAWHNEDAGSTGPRGPGLIYAYASFPCNYQANRSWKDIASGYAEYDGTWYAGQAVQQKTLSCVG